MGHEVVRGGGARRGCGASQMSRSKFVPRFWLEFVLAWFWGVSCEGRRAGWQSSQHARETGSSERGGCLPIAHR